MKIQKFTKLVIGIIFFTILITNVYAIDNKSNENVSIPINEINNFAQVYAITKSYYVESVSDPKLIKGAINGMLTNLDPHSMYLDKNDFKQLSEMTTGSFAGLGIEISRDKLTDGVKVVAPIDGTPAYYAGIKSGDLIIKIDDQPVYNMTLDEAIKKMRGIAGTKVKITISRKNELKPIVFNIKRATIKVNSIKYAMLTPQIPYIRITDFQQDTVPNLINILSIIYKKNNNLTGLIIDLRDNPGGLLPAAVGVSGVFLPNDSLIVYTSGRAPNANQKFYNRKDDYSTRIFSKDFSSSIPQIYKTIPMIVIVNQGTASASEIVSGALQDYKRARIIGTQTFGKGSVQTVIPLSEDTAVKLTTALYYTPNGRSIQALGIKPDIIVKSEYNDLVDSWDMSEASYNNHLANPNHKSQTMLKDATPIISPPKQIKTQSELDAKYNHRINSMPKVVNQNIAVVDLNNDFQLKWALNLIEGKPIPIQKINK